MNETTVPKPPEADPDPDFVYEGPRERGCPSYGIPGFWGLSFDARQRAWLAKCREIFDYRYAQYPESNRLREGIWEGVWTLAPLSPLVHVVRADPVDSFGNLVIPTTAQDPRGRGYVLSASIELALWDWRSLGLRFPLAAPHPLDLIGRQVTFKYFIGTEIKRRMVDPDGKSPYLVLRPEDLQHLITEPWDDNLKAPQERTHYKP